MKRAGAHLDALVFRRGECNFALDASTVAFVHEADTVVGADMPRVDLANVFADGAESALTRDVRVRVGRTEFDVRTGSHLRVMKLALDAVREVPSWLGPMLRKSALTRVALLEREIVWVFDATQLAQLVRREASSP